nr:class I SAM-dependent methyltransferase [Enterovibrio baiacu]
MILARIFKQSDKVDVGLDIGCGTGVSSIALAPYCTSVLGIDPSEAMIAQAVEAQGITYQLGSGEAIPLADNTVDVVTFAGSLSYAKTETLVGELVRVCAPKARIIAYDFDVCLEETLLLLGSQVDVKTSAYDHAINFSGSPELEEEKVVKDTLGLEMDSEQLAHVLLSSTKRYDVFTTMFKSDSPFEPLVKKLDAIGLLHTVNADIYYSTYRC